MALSILGGLSGSKTDTDSKYNKNMWTPEQSGTSKDIFSLLKSGWGSNFGDTQSQPTSYENMALGNLGSFMSGGSTDPAAQARARAMTGQGYENIIDPKATQALYDALYKQTMEKTLPESARSIAGVANMQGMLNSGKGLKMQLNNQQDIVTNLANTLAQLQYGDEQAKRNLAIQREERQLPAAQQEEASQLNKIQAGMTYGGLPRQLEGQKYDNPLTQLALAFLGLRGTESGTGSQNANTLGWNVGAGWGGK